MDDSVAASSDRRRRRLVHQAVELLRVGELELETASRVPAASSLTSAVWLASLVVDRDHFAADRRDRRRSPP